MPKRKNKAKILGVTALALLLVLSYCFWAIKSTRPLLTPVYGNDYSKSFDTNPLNITWPANANAAISIAGSDFIKDNNGSSVSPTASAAKMVTALMIIKKYPLSAGQAGPMLTISQQDVDIFHNYVAADGSVTKVVLGQQISEYDLLESMLIPSSDNAADTGAIWAYGSLNNYSAQANSFLKSKGITNTTIGVDASGLSPTTISTPIDLIKISSLVMNNPILSEIVGKRYATIPVVGTVYNFNTNLGKIGINGVKTGNTEEAGGVLAGSSSVIINDKPVNILVSVMKTSGLSTALSANYNLTAQARVSFSGSEELNQYLGNIGYYKEPWSKTIIQIKAANKSTLIGFNSTKILVHIHLKNVSQKIKAGDVVGEANIVSQVPLSTENIKLVASNAPSKPSNWWLLTHPF